MFENNKVEFYQKYIIKEKNPKLKQMALCITAAYGTTYHCESFFSKLNVVKTKCRSMLLVENSTNQ